jgi:hypothetical protein
VGSIKRQGISERFLDPEEGFGLWIHLSAIRISTKSDQLEDDVLA